MKLLGQSGFLQTIASLNKDLEKQFFGILKQSADIKKYTYCVINPNKNRFFKMHLLTTRINLWVVSQNKFKHILKICLREQ